MKKKIINKKHNKHEPWFKWLTRELNLMKLFMISNQERIHEMLQRILFLEIVLLFQKFLKILMKKIKIH